MHKDERAQGSGSAAFVIAIVSIMMMVTGALVFTVTDPVLQILFDSFLWDANTVDGQRTLQWHHAAWVALPALVLTAILVEIWVVTRQPQ